MRRHFFAQQTQFMGVSRQAGRIAQAERHAPRAGRHVGGQKLTHLLHLCIGRLAVFKAQNTAAQYAMTDQRHQISAHFIPARLNARQKRFERTGGKIALAGVAITGNPLFLPRRTRERRRAALTGELACHALIQFGLAPFVLNKTEVRMGVNINKARGDTQAADIDCLPRQAFGNAGRDGSNFPILDSDICLIRLFACTINDRSVFQKNVIHRLSRLSYCCDSSWAFIWLPGRGFRPAAPCAARSG